MSTLRPVLVAAGLLVGGLSVSSTALACPAADSNNESASTHRAADARPVAEARPATEARSAAEARAAFAAAAAIDQGSAPSSECAYMRSKQTSCCSSSLGSRMLGVAAPAGLVAFGLGWLTGGRRRRRSNEA